MPVREAVKNDLEELTKLYHAFYKELRGRQGLEIRSIQSYVSEVKELMKHDKFFIAEHGIGEAVGFVRVSCRERTYWVEEIYVEPPYRGRG